MSSYNKVDRAALKHLLQEKGSPERESAEYKSILKHCDVAMSGGCITRGEAASLASSVGACSLLADIFPHNIFILKLHEYILSKGTEADHGKILDFIADVYMSGSMLIDIIHNDMRQPHNKKEDLCDKLFDNPVRQGISLYKKIVSFSGKFEYGSRRDCFSQAQKLGAVPCSIGPYTDYLFVADHSVNVKKHFTGSVEAGIHYRMRTGTLLIFRESVWEDSKDNASLYERPKHGTS